MKKLLYVISLVTLCCMAESAQSEPLTNAFTYQGSLKQNSAPFTGTVNIVFRLYDTPTTTTVLGSQTVNGVVVTNGLFAVVLNSSNQFGVNAFNGNRRWLGITVNGTTLSPRQEVTAAPYAQFAAKPWITSGTNIYYTDGRVGIGNGAPAGTRLKVNSTGTEWAIHGEAGNSSVGVAGGSTGGLNARGVYGAVGPGGFCGTSGDHHGSGFYGLLGTQNEGVYGNATTGIGVRAVSGSGRGLVASSETGHGIEAWTNTVTSIGAAVYAHSNFGKGIQAETNGGTAIDAIANTGGIAIGALNRSANGTAIVGVANGGGAGVSASSFTGIGVAGTSPSGPGVKGTSNSSQGVFGESFNWQGVYGHSSNNVGVIGIGEKLDGVWGESHIATAAGVSGWNTQFNGLAGYFKGNVNINGSLSKSGGSFKIDHPLDPENKYLSHSFVESPDMMNIYNGIVTTGADGRAEVTLPGWFEALNRDFRYQLTVIDSADNEEFAQIKVVREIEGNRFAIRSSRPNTKVSWQVTGVRHDKWAEGHRIIVEENKPDAERGKYLDPICYGQPGSMGIERRSKIKLEK